MRLFKQKRFSLWPVVNPRYMEAKRHKTRIPLLGMDRMGQIRVYRLRMIRSKKPKTFIKFDKNGDKYRPKYQDFWAKPELRKWRRYSLTYRETR